MAAAHHHHQHHHHQEDRRPHPGGYCCRSNRGDPLSSYCSSGCCCCCGFTEVDPLAEALATQLIQAASRRPHLCTMSSSRSTSFTKCHISHPQDQTSHTHELLSSLLRRIDALESSLLHFSAPSSNSLRDAAARTIQTHFRAFLVRRSRTLAHLKHLAFIKSAFNSLRSSSSLPHQTLLSCEALSQQAMDLLLKLDSIQDNDSMIRDGKRSLTRDLVRFLDFIDGVSATRHRLRHKPSRNVRTGQNACKSRVLTTWEGSNCRDSVAERRELMEKLRDRVDKIRGFSRVSETGEEDVELEGFQHLSDDEENLGVSEARKGILVNRQGLQPRVKKSVSFAENGNLFTVSGASEPEAVSGSSMDQTELVRNLSRDMGNLSRETEDDDDREDTESGGSSHTSDNERNLGTEDEHEVEHYQSRDGRYVFSAPMPLKMESRTDLNRKIKGIKIIT